MKKFLVFVVFIYCQFPLRAQESSILLDSVATFVFSSENDSIHYSKINYTYTDEGFCLHTAKYLFLNGHWTLVAYQKRVPDDKGRPIEQEDHDQQYWLLGYPYVKHIWEYDETGNLLFTHKYTKSNEDHSWSPLIIQENKFNPDRQRIQMLELIWSEQNRDWAPNALHTYLYNPEGKLMIELIAGWDFNSRGWTVYQKNETNYYADGIIQSEYSYIRYPDTTRWVKRDYWTEYDSAGRLLRQTHANIGAIILSEYVYDSIGNYSVYVSSSTPWTENYEPNIRYDVRMDERMNRVEETEFRRNNGVWIPYRKEQSQFNLKGDIMNRTRSVWSDNIPDWTIEARDHYYYSSASTAISEFQEPGLHVYPNPTSANLTIEGLRQPSDVHLYSLQGQMVRSYHRVTTNIDLSDVLPGTYILRIFSTGQEITSFTITVVNRPTSPNPF